MKVEAKHHYCFSNDLCFSQEPNLLGGSFLEPYVNDCLLVIEIAPIANVDLQTYVEVILREFADSGKKYSAIAFDDTVDPVKEFVERASILSTISVNFNVKSFYFVSEYQVPQQHFQNLTIVMFPVWYFSSRMYNLDKVISVTDKTHPFSCLNRAPSYHRLLFYYYLKQENLLSKFIYSFYGKCPYNNVTIDPLVYDFDLERIPDAQLRDVAAACFKDFPIVAADEPLAINDHTTDHPAYNKAWCNVVTETSYYLPFTSEKIWKPIASKQLFLIIGPPGINSYLESLGFYTFSSFNDNLLSHKKRILSVVREVRIRANIVEQWYSDNIDKIEHNYRLYNSQELPDYFVNSALTQMQK